jgi:FMN phosphatase YigB (HAD superfamily)
MKQFCGFRNIFDNKQGDIWYMQTPAGILFDFGNTILHEAGFNPLLGNTRLLRFAKNPRGYTAEEVQQAAIKLDEETRPRTETSLLEFPDEHFQKLLYERLDISFRISNLRQQWEFWRAAVKHIPEPGIDDLLKYLSRKRIKTGVVSNTMFVGKILERELKKSLSWMY